MPPAHLINLLRAPESASRLTGEQWNDIVLTGRENQLLGQVAGLLDREGYLTGLPFAIKRHLSLALLTAQRRGEAALAELAIMRRAINPAVDVMVLKGCAYVAAGDVNYAGRSFSDVDLMVERGVLHEVENDLISAGWKPSSVDAYDAAYYRNWMHEVPPMSHVRRNTVVDLHHAINPPVSDFYVSPALLMTSRVELSAGVFVLAPLDRVIHCAIHLIQEGEPKKLLRDLYDLHLLLGQHCTDGGGTQPLLDRARQLGVEHLVGVAVAVSDQLFTPNSLRLRPSWLQICLVVAARKAHGPASVSGWLASTAVLAYAHWIKMPLHLLIPHLWRKSMKALFSNDRDTDGPKNA